MMTVMSARLSHRQGRILIRPDVIRRRVARLAAAIAKDLGEERDLAIVALLRGSFMFLADLVRELFRHKVRVTLDFMALSSERYDLVIRREHLDLAPVQRLLDTLCQAALRRELATLCAYDTSETGRRVA